jgi:hypothetical protein
MATLTKSLAGHLKNKVSLCQFAIRNVTLCVYTFFMHVAYGSHLSWLLNNNAFDYQLYVNFFMQSFLECNHIF